MQTIKDFMASAPKLSVTVTLGFLCFNTKQISLDCFKDLLQEADRLEVLGAKVHVIVMDNGDDGTFEAIKEIHKFDRTIILIGNGVNHGQSAGRNAIIIQAMKLKSDYLMFVDGDINVVPLSSYCMTVTISSNPKMGCLSAHPVRQTPEKAKATPFCDSSDQIQNDMTTACTGYAIYNMEVFHRGIRFDDKGPFNGPGWGLEDDDIYLQMKSAGWEVCYFTNIIYCQTKLRSSWPALYADGVDIQQVFKERQAYLSMKWADKGFDDHMARIMAQSIPAYVPEVSDVERGYSIRKWREWPNFCCLKCAYKTLWEEKIVKHVLAGIHVWGMPGQHPKKIEDTNVPTY